MAHYLPPAIMRFFQPRPPIEAKVAVSKRKMLPLSGVASFVQFFKNDAPDPVIKETPKERKEKRLKKKEKKEKERLRRQLVKWDPKKNEGPATTADAYKTLFVARLSFKVTEDDLKNEFEYYGNIIKVRIVKSGKNNKSRGYGFVEFESSRDLKEAYKDADGRKVMERRILVDVERGRTVKNWKPRRLGGGLGGTRIGGKDQNMKYSGREPPRSTTTSSSGGSSSSSTVHKERSDRDRDRDRSDRDRERERSDRDRDRDRDRERSDRDKDKEKDKDKDKERDKDRDRKRDRERRDRSSERKRERSRSRDDKRKR